jgi:hypothetical protein
MMRIKVKADVYISTMDETETIEGLALKTEITLNSLGEIDIGLATVFGRGPERVAARFHFHEIEDLMAKKKEK